MAARLRIVAPSKGIFSKIERAEKHIKDLQVASESFFDSRPYKIAHQINPKSSERTYYMTDVSDVPDEIVLICGDAIHNLRSALDHLAYRLVTVTGKRPSKRVAFPIADSAAEYMSPPFRRKVKLMRQNAIELIDSLKPYKGGNDLLWRLKEMDDIDKHRLLLAAGTRYTAHRATPSERQRLMDIFRGSHPGEPVPHFSGTLMALKDVRMLKRGDELRTIPESEVEQYMQFHVDIAFDEPEVCVGESMLQTLHQMSKMVSAIATGFDEVLA